MTPRELLTYAGLSAFFLLIMLVFALANNERRRVFSETGL